MSTSLARGPLLIVALPRSFSSIVSTMLGQHPQLYGFPELHLFVAERMTEWMHFASRSSFSMEHGLLRSVAQLLFKEQTEHTVKMARAWIMRHRDFTTGMVFDSLLHAIHPRVGVEKGPTLILRPEYLQRALRLYPDARFLHLVRHPLSYGGSVLQLSREEAARGDKSRWLLELLCYPEVHVDDGILARATPLSAQRGWHDLNEQARKFLSALPASQHRLLRGEELLASPRETLRSLAEWLGVDSDERAVEAMMHPERSPYASFGPPGAENGGDPHFLGSPAFHPMSAHKRASHSHDSGELLPEVSRLASELGY